MKSGRSNTDKKAELTLMNEFTNFTKFTVFLTVSPLKTAKDRAN